MDSLLIAAFVTGCLALVLNVVGLSIPYWAVPSGLPDGQTGHIGLWVACGTDVFGRTACESIVYNDPDPIDASLNAIRSMVILSMLVFCGALTLLILRTFVLKNRQVLLKISAVLNIIAGVLGLIGCIICAAKFANKRVPFFGDYPLKLHAGFALTLVASLLGVVSGVLSCLVKPEF